MLSDYTVQIISTEIKYQDAYSFALFHPSAKTPIMYSPYLFDLAEVLRLAELLAKTFGVAFINPYAPMKLVKKKNVRRLILLQGGSDEGDDLQGMPKRQIVLCEAVDEESR